jgi:hypothetical protein
MSRALNDLVLPFRTFAIELIARCVEARIPILIVCTRRTAEAQAEALATGHSSVVHSKHQDGLAIDLVPYEVYALHGEDKLAWNPDDPVWLRLGALGESLGLRWGGRWRVPRDPGHFEWQKPQTLTTPT